MSEVVNALRYLMQTSTPIPPLFGAQYFDELPPRDNQKSKFKNRESSSYANLAACHQKAAANAAKIESSGSNQAHPRATPVQPAPAKAASDPKTLRMIGHRSPDQLQFQPPAQRRQRVQPPAKASPRIFPAMGATRTDGFPVRPIRVLPAGSALN